jgi:hypothetical protein
MMFSDFFESLGGLIGLGGLGFLRELSNLNSQFSV